MSVSIVYYGAGENLRRNIESWCNQGLFPVCISDINPSKQHTVYSMPGGQEREVLPLYEVFERYPDYELWLTQAPFNLRAVRRSLIDCGVPPERIRFCEQVEWRMGCDMLGNAFVSIGTHFSTCCSKKAFLLKSTGDFESEMKLYMDFCKQRIKELRNGYLAVCDGCHLLKEDLYPMELSRPVHLSVTSNFEKDRCNFKCIYCYCGQEYQNSVSYKNGLFGYDMVLRFVDGKNGDDFDIGWNSGEITINPHFDELMELWLDKNIKGSISTNASVFNKKLAWVFRYTETVLDVSLDAGTQETFKKVKGVDYFFRVIENLERYADFAHTVKLKYVCCKGVNVNINDMNGFLEVAKRLSIKAKVDIRLSHDHSHLPTIPQLTDDEFDFLCDFYQKAVSIGFCVDIMRECFLSTDYQSLIEKVAGDT